MAKKTKSATWTVITLIVLVASWYYQAEGQGIKEPKKESRTKSAIKAANYEVLDKCRLVENRRNDGDSFYVKHGEKETEFRLYYVDSPESRYRKYSNGETNGERIQAQGEYFGGLNREKTTAVGVQAKKLVRDVLGKQPFKVITQWENVYGPQRRYAFVLVNYRGKQTYLHELLVERGLVRIHTKPATMPDGLSRREQLSKLKRIEAKAKRAKLGGWGM